MSGEASRPLRCVVCGAVLVESVNPDEITTVGGQHLRFRRHTDFVVCHQCMALYRARDLQDGRVVPVTDQELVQQDEAVPDRGPGDG